MRLYGLICSFLAVALASGLGGCSWMTMRTAPSGYHPGRVADCSGCAAPVVDLIASGVLFAGGVTMAVGAATTCPSCSYEEGYCPAFCDSMKPAFVISSVAMLAVGLVYLASGITGFSWAKKCGVAREEREDWLAMRPKQRVAYDRQWRRDLMEHCEPLLTGRKRGFGPRREGDLREECQEVLRHRSMEWESADLGEIYEGGETHLHRAAWEGNVEGVEILVMRGADVNAVNSAGLTPLYWAILQGHMDVVRLLIESGAEIDAALPSGVNPLFWAIVHGRRYIAERLRYEGADL